MDMSKLKDFLGTLEGLLTVVGTLAGFIAVIWAQGGTAFAAIFSALGLSSVWWPRLASSLLIVASLLLLWRRFHRFALASRIAQPDAFTLRPTTPETLIGRGEELAALLGAVKRYREVLLSGESGCGKSALVGAGLVPSLQRSGALLPVPLGDWGDDWVMGPLAATLDGLFNALSVPERERCGWTAPPDLAAKLPAMLAVLRTRLLAVFNVLHKRPLLIADQFDDYQARHRSRFLSMDGNWIAPAALARSNPFWQLVAAGLESGHLHLLVVSRADTAGGLACVSFLAPESIAARPPLGRVGASYLRPLLVNIAPPEASPPVVSHPDRGWVQLCEVLERDLKAEGAILMQQVRTVLLGLRGLDMLTPRHYHAHGGLRGIEALVIARALEAASAAGGGGEAGKQAASAVLDALVLPGGPSEPPKARRVAVAVLQGLVAPPTGIDAILAALQHDEIIRPANGAAGQVAWQLDHDYLARAVMQHASQQKRWPIALAEGQLAHERAAGNWRRRYTTLLPMLLLLRLCWERLRRRLRFGAASGYVATSALKPLGLALALSLAAWATLDWRQDLALTESANRLVSALGGSGRVDAVMGLWRAPDRLRERVYRLVRGDPSALEIAIAAKWPLAHAGLEPQRVVEAAALLRARLVQERDATLLDRVEKTYTALVPRMPQQLVQADAAFFHARLRQRNVLADVHQLQAYASLAGRLRDATDILQASVLLGTELGRNHQYIDKFSLERAFEVVAARLERPDDVRALAEALRQSIASAQRGSPLEYLVLAYVSVAKRLPERDAMKLLADNLERRLVRGEGVDSMRLYESYALLVAELEDDTALKDAAALILRQPVRDVPDYLRSSMERAYAKVATRMHDPAALKAAAVTMRTWLEQDGGAPYAKIDAYAAIVAKLDDQTFLAEEALALRAMMARAINVDVERYATAMEAALTAPMRDRDQVRQLASRLCALWTRHRGEDSATIYAGWCADTVVRTGDDAMIEQFGADMLAALARIPTKELESPAIVLAGSLRRIAEKTGDPAILGSYAARLRAMIAANRDPYRIDGLLLAFAGVATLRDFSDQATAARLLRARLEDKVDDDARKSLVAAYAVVASAALRTSNPAQSAAMVRQVLTVASNPFVEEPASLLSVLEQVAGQEFDGSLDAVVRWAEATYGILPAQLRPPPGAQ